jgi:uncharacterized protein
MDWRTSKAFSNPHEKSRNDQKEGSEKPNSFRKHLVKTQEETPDIVFESLLAKTHFQVLKVSFSLLEASLKLFGLFEKGKKNTLDIRLDEKEFRFSSLPLEFDGVKILFLTDLHLGLGCGLKDRIIEVVREIDVDLCLIGGDYRYGLTMPVSPVLEEMREIIESINTPMGIYGVRGNHDPLELVPALEEMGILMLMNSSVTISKGEQQIYLAGVDDPFHYKAHDLDRAFKKVSEEEFSIFMAHTPQLNDEAERFGADFYLCGHTHNSQIKIPWVSPLVAWAHGIQNKFFYGEWRNKRMKGYTGAGVGASGVKVRFRCPPEIGILTLKRKVKN